VPAQKIKKEKEKEKEFYSAADSQTGNVGCIRSPSPCKLSLIDFQLKAIVHACRPVIGHEHFYFFHQASASHRHLELQKVLNLK